MKNYFYRFTNYKFLNYRYRKIIIYIYIFRINWSQKKFNSANRFPLLPRKKTSFDIFDKVIDRAHLNEQIDR